jgi:hypothetical protein
LSSSAPTPLLRCLCSVVTSCSLALDPLYSGSLRRIHPYSAPWCAPQFRSRYSSLPLFFFPFLLFAPRWLLFSLPLFFLLISYSSCCRCYSVPFILLCLCLLLTLPRFAHVCSLHSLTDDRRSSPSCLAHRPDDQELVDGQMRLVPFSLSDILLFKLKPFFRHLFPCSWRECFFLFKLPFSFIYAPRELASRLSFFPFLFNTHASFLGECAPRCLSFFFSFFRLVTFLCPAVCFWFAVA